MRRAFIDTEFADYGPHGAGLVSIGVVVSDGPAVLEYYGVNSEFDPRWANSWVQANVLAKAGGPRHSPETMRGELLAVCDGVEEFWAWYGCYDWFLFMNLMGGFHSMPASWPHYYNELMTLAAQKDCGERQLPPQGASRHHALADAKWLAGTWAFLNCLAPVDQEEA